MYVCFDSAVVLDYRPGIDDAVFADDCPRVHDYSWHYNSARSNARGRSNDGSGVNENRRRKAICECAAEASCAYPVVAYGTDKGTSGKASQFLLPTLDQAVAKGDASFRGVIVQKCDALETASTPGGVQHHLSVASSAPNE
jgi:hypothetical protein